MSGIRELFDLQEIDRQVDARSLRLAQIAHELEGSPELMAARAELGVREARLTQAQQAQRRAEDEAGANQSRITMQEQRMYGGQTTAAGVLQSLTAEVAHLKERQGPLDQAVLLAIDAVDPLQKQHKDQVASVAALESALAGQRERLSAEAAKLQGELAQWQARHQRHATSLAPPSLSLYNRLRATKGNLAVVRVERGTCGGCRMTVPAVLVQKARSGKELVHCSSCARLLFVA